MIRPRSQSPIPQNPRGHPVQMRPRHRVEIRIPRPIRLDVRQRYAENPVIPLKIQPGYQELPSQLLQIEIVVADPPRVILAKTVNHQTIAAQIGDVSESVLARAGSDVDDEIGEQAAALQVGILEGITAYYAVRV